MLYDEQLQNEVEALRKEVEELRRQNTGLQAEQVLGTTVRPARDTNGAASFALEAELKSMTQLKDYLDAEVNRYSQISD